ncbi:endonuclease III [Clostridium cellulovorans 743B]|uniref:Endonuclease III n=2 Tax=Clostridium cellulovorans TaxID=1493 RepID=D9SVG1_CLOC7|nr:endonuclease III [Clostridium cellulovorans 743B]
MENIAYKDMDKEKSKIVIDKLSEMYPNAKCELNFHSAYELLIATMMSAQSTDVRVNIITEDLFENYYTPEQMVTLSEEELQEKIKSCGLYKSKAKNILATSRILIEKYNGQVPKSIEELTTLPGVGKKTANVVASNVFGIPAIAVDTHVFRVANRIGIAEGKTPEKVEEQLMEAIPKEKWSDSHHYLIWHGRRICKARKPECEVCNLKYECNYYNKR